MFERLERRLRDERGIALVLSLLIVAALTISTAAVVALSSSNERAFGRDRLEARAFNTAEQAFNEAIATLRTVDNGTMYGNPVNGSIFPSTAGSKQVCCSGLGQWWAKKISSTQWQIWSTGLSPNGDVLRKLSVRTFVDTTTTETQPSAAWGYGFFVANPTACTNMVGNANITVSTYINGDLCLNGTNQIAEPNASGPREVELYTKGGLYIVGSSGVGTSTRSILKANNLGGCFKNGQAWGCNNSLKSKVYASIYSATISPLTKPVVDGPGTYASGRWSTPTCTVGSFTFDTNTTRDTSVGTFDLFPASDYDCTVVDQGGGYLGRLKWVAATSTLTIDGVLFIDGNMALAGGDQAQYTGSGTIYINGTATTNGNSTLCGPPSTVSGTTCTGVWDADQGALSFVALNAGNAATTWQMNGNAEYNVLLYVVGKFSQTGTAFVTGPVIMDSGFVGGTSEHTDVDNPPVGTPGSHTQTTTSTWKVVEGSWQQLPNGG